MSDNDELDYGSEASDSEDDVSIYDYDGYEDISDEENRRLEELLFEEAGREGSPDMSQESQDGPSITPTESQTGVSEFPTGRRPSDGPSDEPSIPLPPNEFSNPEPPNSASNPEPPNRASTPEPANRGRRPPGLPPWAPTPPRRVITPPPPPPPTPMPDHFDPPTPGRDWLRLGEAPKRFPPKPKWHEPLSKEIPVEERNKILEKKTNWYFKEMEEKWVAMRGERQCRYCYRRPDQHRNHRMGECVRELGRQPLTPEQTEKVLEEILESAIECYQKFYAGQCAEEELPYFKSRYYNFKGENEHIRSLFQGIDNSRNRLRENASLLINEVYSHLDRGGSDADLRRTVRMVRKELEEDSRAIDGDKDGIATVDVGSPRRDNDGVEMGSSRSIPATAASRRAVSIPVPDTAMAGPSLATATHFRSLATATPAPSLATATSAPSLTTATTTPCPTTATPAPSLVTPVTATPSLMSILVASATSNAVQTSVPTSSTATTTTPSTITPAPAVATATPSTATPRTATPMPAVSTSEIAPERVTPATGAPTLMVAAPRLAVGKSAPAMETKAAAISTAATSTPITAVTPATVVRESVPRMVPPVEAVVRRKEKTQFPVRVEPVRVNTPSIPSSELYSPRSPTTSETRDVKVFRRPIGDGVVRDVIVLDITEEEDQAWQESQDSRPRERERSKEKSPTPELTTNSENRRAWKNEKPKDKGKSRISSRNSNFGTESEIEDESSFQFHTDYDVPGRGKGKSSKSSRTAKVERRVTFDNRDSPTVDINMMEAENDQYHPIERVEADEDPPRAMAGNADEEAYRRRDLSEDSRERNSGRDEAIEELSQQMEDIKVKMHKLLNKGKSGDKDRRDKKESDRRDRDRDRDGERERDRDRDRDRERDRNRDRDQERDRDRERARDRNDDRHGDRSRDRDGERDRRSPPENLVSYPARRSAEESARMESSPQPGSSGMRPSIVPPLRSRNRPSLPYYRGELTNPPGELHAGTEAGRIPGLLDPPPETELKHARGQGGLCGGAADVEVVKGARSVIEVRFKPSDSVFVYLRNKRTLMHQLRSLYGQTDLYTILGIFQDRAVEHIRTLEPMLTEEGTYRSFEHFLSEFEKIAYENLHNDVMRRFNSMRQQENQDVRTFYLEFCEMVELLNWRKDDFVNPFIERLKSQEVIRAVRNTYYPPGQRNLEKVYMHASQAESNMRSARRHTSTSSSAISGNPERGRGKARGGGNAGGSGHANVDDGDPHASVNASGGMLARGGFQSGGSRRPHGPPAGSGAGNGFGEGGSGGKKKKKKPGRGARGRRVHPFFVNVDKGSKLRELVARLRQIGLEKRCPGCCVGDHQFKLDFTRCAFRACPFCGKNYREKDAHPASACPRLPKTKEGVEKALRGNK